MPCSYCGIPGCEFETCPERLEDKFGTPDDYDNDGDWDGEENKQRQAAEGAAGP